MISSASARRWGNLALVAMLAGSLGTVGLVALKVPGLMPFVPVTISAVLAGAYLFSKPRLNFIVWLGGLALLFSNEEGIQLHEALYGLYFYAYLLRWYGRRLLLYRQPIIRGPVDVAIALWLVLGLILGIALGVLFGADPVHIRGEAIALTMLAIYFPIKEFCVSDKNGPAIVLAIMAWMGIWVTFENLIAVRETFAQATHVWEIASVRTSGRELLLMSGGVLVLSVLPTLKTRGQRMAMALLLAVLLGGLILTKSRTFWVEYLVAILVLVAITSGRDRKHLIAWCVTGAAILVAFSMIFLPSYINLLVSGITSRVETLGATSSDISLINRFVESEAVLSNVWQNPILGRGLGTQYSFFDIIALRTISRSYSHIGLLAVVYKFGLWGSILVAFAWIGGLVTVFRSSLRPAKSAFDRALLKGVVACSASLILPALTASVFFEDEKLAAFMLISAVGLGVHYRTELS